MKRLFWIAIMAGLTGFALALMLYLLIRIEGTGRFGALIVFFVPLMMLGLSGTVIGNFIYYSKKTLLTSKEKKAALTLAVLALGMIFLL